MRALSARNRWLALIYGVVLASAKRSDAQTPLQFYNLAPCRAVDTRSAGFGGKVQSATIRNFQMKGVCGVDAGAQAVTLNLTAIGPTCGGYILVYAAGAALPAVSNINFNAGEPAIANAAVVPVASGSPDLSVVYGVATGTCFTDVALDVTGYFK